MLPANVAHDIYSQFGEDGYIDAALRLIGETNRWCFEVGAHDGRFYSNTLRLREMGWIAILAERDKRHFEMLAAEFGNNEQTFCVHKEVTDLDDLLSHFGCPSDPDLGVIDIDGQDYWLWHDMTQHRPRLLLIEHCPYTSRETCYQHAPVPRNEAGQTAKDPLIKLANDRHYELIAETYCNLLFLDSDRKR